MKQAQFDLPVMTFVLIFVSILILAPISLKIIRSIVPPLAENLAINPNANISATYITTKTTNFWDFGVVLAFLIMTIFIFLSAYFVDMHPVFIVIYIILGFFMFLAIPAMSEIFTNLYDVEQFSTEINAMPITLFLANHFGIIVFAIFIISGIIMYGKIRRGSENP